ncbi:acetylpolyamine amidohydrolase [Bordetella genomosp. 1]|uniref:Acetylpolyamine amidohydrolase n=1 Tax=Bordetella genomosp. 1 TaxID=1395607 RepID=A0A261S682_9BORD|nr:histone deacetylase family protein [Bordetella genomosp. 1]MDQ8030705.1 histone deacetylase family protein [Bordetella sp.]OZI32878.1 acetylpolyamine amidohydrolase [Bordetella genomosp. 1]OZI65771.1 acetylpolyamine amidohydrolase [Bordetella genomosp. 1]
MKAFFSEEQLLHEPQQFMRLGRLCAPTDLPARAETLRALLQSRGISVENPTDYGREPLEGVHSNEYLDYLEHAYTRWQALRGSGLEPGIEVLPNLSPYYNGRVEHAARGPCPSTSIVAETGYYLSDLSCPIGPHTWRSALRSTHCATAAADWVLQHDGLAYALCRPSGHHAHRDRAGGFCYLNSSATAAHRLAQTFDRVAVLDVDAHHGDGTQNIFYQRSDVMTLSLHADPTGYYPFYTGYAHERGYGSGHGYNLNFPLPHGADNGVFLDTLDSALIALRDYRPQALVLALGFDTYKDDPISVLRLDLDAYRHIGERINSLGLPTVVVQEGGYQVASIGQALDAFMQGMAAVPA